MNAELQHVLDTLTAERYGPSHWWKTTLPETITDDSETATARRRRRMAEDFATSGSETETEAS